MLSVVVMVSKECVAYHWPHHQRFDLAACALAQLQIFARNKLVVNTWKQKN
jgi:hypothetical protein